MKWITKSGKHIPIFDEQMWLDTKEYSKVCHEIDSNGNKEEKRINSINIKNIGEYAYVYYYHDVKPIVFYCKVKIVGNEQRIKTIKEYLRSGTLHGFF